jgi:hypothetical protein
MNKLIIIAFALVIIIFWWLNYLFENHVISQKNMTRSSKDISKCNNCDNCDKCDKCHKCHKCKCCHKNISNLESFTSLFDSRPYSMHRKYNKTVDLPLNTYYSCKNMCGPLARCYKTGEQCTKDHDCFGCKPGKNPKIKKPKPIPLEGFENYLDDLKPVPHAHFGPNTWIDTFRLGMQIYKQKQQWRLDKYPNDYEFIPKYPMRETATGLYITDDVSTF